VPPTLKEKTMLTALVFLTTSVYAKPPEMPKIAPTEVKEGNLSEGKKIDLLWAQSSQVTCFPGTYASSFNGNHVFYRLTQKPSQDLYFRLTPPEGVDVSMYVLQNAKPAGALPPNVEVAWRCNKAYYDNPGEPELLHVAGYNKDFDVVVAVVGAKEATSGAFKLEIWDVPGRQW
jgi:hypothetical protein